MPRIYCSQALQTGAELDLPSSAARHVQVLRLQPGHELSLFDGRGGEYLGAVTHMGRSEVRVRVLSHQALERESATAVHLALGVPANERMDWLVEKATELGVSSVTPLMTERTVLRLSGERAQKKQAHWQAVAVAACEQCGRNRVPTVHPVQNLSAWVQQWSPQAGPGWLLSLQADSQDLRTQLAARGSSVYVLSGPEGGLSPAEESAALARGLLPVSLGARTLRAETAALAVLAAVNLLV